MQENGQKVAIPALFSKAKKSARDKHTAEHTDGFPYSHYRKNPHTSTDNRYKDLYLKDIARATSAAPTYFEPFKIDGKGTFIDGGVAVNNPAMSAYVEILKILEKNNIDPATKKIVVISIGTGTASNSLCYEEIKNWNPIQWVTGPLISTFFDGNSHTVEYQLRKILPQDCYYRFQIQLPDEKGADDLDNTSEKSLNRIKELTQRYIDHDQVNGLPIGWYSKIINLLQIL